MLGSGACPAPQSSQEQRTCPPAHSHCASQDLEGIHPYTASMAAAARTYKVGLVSRDIPAAIDCSGCGAWLGRSWLGLCCVAAWQTEEPLQAKERELEGIHPYTASMAAAVRTYKVGLASRDITAANDCSGCGAWLGRSWLGLCCVAAWQTEECGHYKLRKREVICIGEHPPPSPFNPSPSPLPAP